MKVSSVLLESILILSFLIVLTKLYLIKDKHVKKKGEDTYD